MYLIDTHTHLFVEEFDSDRDEMIGRTVDAGVWKCVLPNIGVDSIARLQETCDRYPKLCFPAMGLHPTSVKADYQEVLKQIESCFSNRNYVAVGEIGIDLYWDKTFEQEQIAAFEEQLCWSIELNLPVIIHTREAFPQVFTSLKRVGGEQLRGIFHSFGGSRAELEEALSYPNFLLGINGVITYKKAQFRDYLAIAPLHRIVLETDAPYLTPVPHRGQRNEPSYLPYIVEKLAEVYQIQTDSVIEQTTENAERLFGI
jgi:TatD DNase family protein